MQTTVERYKNNSGKEIIQGEGIYRDVKFSYRVHKASNQKEYSHVLKASIISPNTNRILQFGGKRYNDFRKKLDKKIELLTVEVKKLDPMSAEFQKAESVLRRQMTKKERLGTNLPIEDLNATASTYLTSVDDKTIKKAFEEVVVRLYADYQDDIFQALGSTAEKDLHTRTLYDMYQNDFFRSLPATTAKVLKGKKNALLNICNRLNEKSVRDLTDKDIEQVERVLGNTKRNKMRLAEKFLDYCGESGGYTGANPITTYYQHKGNSKKSKGPPRNPLYPTESTHIAEEPEQKLHDALQHQLDNDAALAIALAKGFRMSMDRILTICWKDIIIDGTHVWISDYHDNYTGGTHNYIRPPLGETTDFILTKYNQLIEKHGKTKLGKMLVVPVPGKTMGERKTTVTKYIRTMLAQAGVKKEDFEAALDKDNPKAAGGAGYQLLIKHYDYVLQEHCGVDLDSGLGHYLRGLRIYDTTTDYYRCLSDETGNNFLQRIMRRDNWVAPPLNKDTIICCANGETNKYTILPGGPGTRTGVVTTQAVFVPAGFEVSISAPLGIEGEIYAIETLNGSPPVKYQEIF